MTQGYDLDTPLERTAALHRHLCPRQVLGVRIGLLGGSLLGIALPQEGKRLLVIAETDGCAADGISAATGCTVGHRTLRIEDYGKLAATFVDTLTETSFRVAPHRDIRARAVAAAPAGSSRWEAYLIGYQRMPDSELFCAEEVGLVVPAARLVSRPHSRTVCAACGEEIHNEREILSAGKAYCRSCAGDSYYVRRASSGSSPAPAPVEQVHDAP